MLSDYRAHNERLVQSMDRLSSGKKAADARDDPTLWSEVEELKQFATLLTGFSGNLNRAAATVRVAIDSMDVAKDHLAQAEDALSRAYAEPAGSEARRLMVESYNEFLDFIDDAAEAPDAGARRLLDSPDNFPDAGDIKISAGENNYFVTLRAREIHTGADGLDLPRAGGAIPSDVSGTPLINDINDATNDELKAMLDRVEIAQNTLSGRVKALTVDASSIEDSEVFNSVFITRNKNLSEKINMPNLEAEAIIAQSIQMKSALSLSGLGSSDAIGKLAIQLLK